MINLILLFTTHFIADFLCQTREMATNKGKSVYWLTIHVLVYSSVTTLCWMFFTLNPYTLMFIWMATFSSHWITDFITSKFTTHFYLKNNMFGFFSVIGFDQLIHAITLLSTYNFFIKTI